MVATKSTRFGWEFLGITIVMDARRDLAGERRIAKERAGLNLLRG